MLVVATGSLLAIINPVAFNLRPIWSVEWQTTPLARE